MQQEKQKNTLQQHIRIDFTLQIAIMTINIKLSAATLIPMYRNKSSLFIIPQIIKKIPAINVRMNNMNGGLQRIHNIQLHRHEATIFMKDNRIINILHIKSFMKWKSDNIINSAAF